MERKMTMGRLKYLSLHQLAWGLLILSVLDAGLTDLALRTGIAYEANPIAAQLYAWDSQHVMFYLIKIVVPLFVIVLSYKVQHQRVVLPFIWMAMMVYGIILLFHVLWITVYIRMLF